MCQAGRKTLLTQSLTLRHIYSDNVTHMMSSKLTYLFKEVMMAGVTLNN